MFYGRNGLWTDRMLHRLPETPDRRRPAPDLVLPAMGAGEGRTMSTIPLPVLGAISATIAPENNGYQVGIHEGENTVYTKFCKTPPWISPQIIMELANRSHAELNPDARPEPERYKKALARSFSELNTLLETDRDLKRSLSGKIVIDIIKKTEQVVIYPGETTALEVTLDGKKLCFSAHEIAMQDAGVFNERYFNEMLTTLDATRSDWKEIRDYWCETAVVQEKQSETRMDLAIEALADYLSDEMVFYTERDRVTGPETGFCNEKEGTMWVLSLSVRRFIENYDPKLPAAELAKELLARGCTTRPSQKERYPNLPGNIRNTWRFTPGFTTFHIDCDRPDSVIPDEGEGDRDVPVSHARE